MNQPMPQSVPPTQQQAPAPGGGDVRARRPHHLLSLLWLVPPVIGVLVYPLVDTSAVGLRTLNAFIGVYVVLLAIVVHEVAHGAMAFWCGDSTALEHGRITLNPLSHLRVFGSLVLPIGLFAVGAPAVVGWARPVPTNPLRLHKFPRDQVAVALAGPLSNLVLSFVFFLGFVALAVVNNQYNVESRVALTWDLQMLGGAGSGFGGGVWFLMLSLCALGTQVNTFIAAFNMLPVAPLDGFAVVRGAFPAGATSLLARASIAGLVLLALGLFYGLHYLVLFPAVPVAGLYWIISTLCLG